MKKVFACSLNMLMNESDILDDPDKNYHREKSKKT